jgi:hypothetical protein
MTERGRGKSKSLLWIILIIVVFVIGFYIVNNLVQPQLAARPDLRVVPLCADVCQTETICDGDSFCGDDESLEDCAKRKASNEHPHACPSGCVIGPNQEYYNPTTCEDGCCTATLCIDCEAGD